MTLGISWTYLSSVIFWITFNTFFFVIPTDLRGGYYLGTTDVKTSPGSRLSQVNGGVPSLEGLVVVAGCRHCGRFLMGTSTF
jgi:hypothetical protein